MTKHNSFGHRKKSRRLALQALYGWTLTQNPLQSIESHVLKEHDGENFDKDYFQILLFEIPNHLQEIEDALVPHLAKRSWEDLDMIELNILRIGAYELLFHPEIPYRVVINESLELAKTFGAKESFKFVNGVLDQLAHVARKIEIGSKF